MSCEILLTERLFRTPKSSALSPQGGERKGFLWPSVKGERHHASAVPQYLGLCHLSPWYSAPQFGQTQILGHIPRQVYRGP